MQGQMFVKIIVNVIISDFCFVFIIKKETTRICAIVFFCVTRMIT